MLSFQQQMEDGDSSTQIILGLYRALDRQTRRKESYKRAVGLCQVLIIPDPHQWNVRVLLF